ncbi:Adenosine 5'-monophosphoramidase [Microbotryomycetes sp. JL201]|nr:Adenosine 5'-monophosphoramidase [Microbotryomycetes sp. JL201]
MSSHHVDANCIFCKIIKDADDVYRSSICLKKKSRFSFFDIGPLSKGHALVIPKHHGAKLHDIPDDSLTELLPIAKKIAQAVGATDYNILQNNGRIAHQEVDHVHVHMIPKPKAGDDEGLVVGWPAQKANMEELKAFVEEIKNKL